VGEVWLTADDNRIASGPLAGKSLGELCRSCGPGLLGRSCPETGLDGGAAFPLLVKFIFTGEKLSVQVHPSDDYARQAHGCSGKTEMWHVLHAETGARLALGFREEMPCPDRETLLNAIQSGAVEHWLNWVEVRAGDTFFVPAGTVHAIGAGLVLCEIQQNSDITYRLFDYNRGRQLHVNQALGVMQWRTNGARTEPLYYAGVEVRRQCLVACPYFAVEKIELDRSVPFRTERGFDIWIGIEGAAEFDMEGQCVNCGKGEALIVPAPAPPFVIQPLPAATFLRIFEPDLRSDILEPLRASGYSEQQLRRVCFPERPSYSLET